MSVLKTQNITFYVATKKNGNNVVVEICFYKENIAERNEIVLPAEIAKDRIKTETITKIIANMFIKE